MKYIKIYEQFMDMEDLSDEEIFGEEVQKDLILGCNGGVFYVLYDPDLHRELYRRYNYDDVFIYDDDMKNRVVYKKSNFFRSYYDLNDQSTVSYRKKGVLIRVNWDKLDPTIKNRINLLKF